MNSDPKVLVVTLYSGENEYEACKKSVKQQVGVDIVHRVIEFLPKQEAHQKLYQMFDENRQEFSYFAKLDADMEFSSPKSLKNILTQFSEGVDVVSATVHDGMTNSDMQSFNVFSSRCYFHYEANDPLFTDQLKVDYPGRQYSYVDHERNVLHAFNPSPFQAFMFGVHRALKVVQPGEKVPSLNNSYHQRVILNQTYRFWLETKSEHLEYALWGATLVFQNIINSPQLFQKSDYNDVFDEVRAKGGVPIDSRLSKSDLLSLVKIIGFGRFSVGVFDQALKKVKLKLIK